MTKEELQEAINNAKHNIELWTKELEEPERKRWQPKTMEEYYYASYCGDILRDFWDDLPGETECLKIGNVFKNEEEATKERDRRLAEAELLDMCDGEQSKPYKIKKMWYIQYNLMHDFPETKWGDATLINPYIFATKETAVNAIDTLGVEKLKLIFRVV